MGDEWRVGDSTMKHFVLLFALTLISCKREPIVQKALVDVTVRSTDVDHFLKESNEESRTRAEEKLSENAIFVKAALDAGLADDPVVRAEVARILISRLRETELFPKLKDAAAAPIPEARLREVYEEGGARFFAAEKRQIAVLWLNPGKDPERAKTYKKKLESAREWLSKNDVPANKGFGVVSIDHSEHAATRYKGGVLGWFPQDGGGSAWEKEVVQISYSLKNIGDVSPVVEGSNGLLLVRHMGVTAAKDRSFDEVRATLEREERGRIQSAIEKEFERGILGTAES